MNTNITQTDIDIHTDRRTIAMISMISGIGSVLFLCLNFFILDVGTNVYVFFMCATLFFSILGLILGILSRKSKSRRIAIVGILLSMIPLVIGLIFLFFGVLFILAMYNK